MTSPGPVETGRGTPARRRVIVCVATALGLYLNHIEARSWRTYSAASTSDPRFAVMVACSNALAAGYRALLVLTLAAAGVRRLRTSLKGDPHV